MADTTSKNPQGSDMPDWVLLEVIKRAGWTGYTVEDARRVYNGYCVTGGPCFRSLCDMILKYEQPPVDRKLLCVREVFARGHNKTHAKRYRDGDYDKMIHDTMAIQALTLYEEGFGK